MADGIGLNGTLSSHVVLRKGTAIAVVPQSVSDGPALLAACPLAIAFSGVLRVLRCHHPTVSKHEEEDPSVTQPLALVQGCGLLGILTCAVLVENGFKVFCTDPNISRLHLASKFSAQPIFRETGPLTPSAVLPAQLDLVVHACGGGRTESDHQHAQHSPLAVSPSSSLSEAVNKLLRPGGTLLLIGHSSSTSSIPITTISEKGLCVIGASGYEPSNLLDAVNFLTATEDKYPYNELLSPAYGLLDFQNALTSALEKKFLRVVVRPTAT